MCGIAGILDRESPLNQSKTLHILKAMSDQIRHRGPDGEGQYVEGHIGIAHRRLAVIDLNERSLQPMVSADQRLAVVFNGEIYNYRDLRSQLQDKGYSFRTESDTEVLLHGFHCWGESLPSKLRGMFAFAVWDASRKLLFLARDRFGKKPLYYVECGPKFIFGSEIKSMLRAEELHPEANIGAIHDFLSFGYSLGEQTAFENIKRLQPGHYLFVQPGVPLKPKQYWNLQDSCHPKRDVTIEQAAEELVEQLEDATKIRMEADVPLGAFLSGGVDSSAIVAVMSRHMSGTLNTFSVGFPIEGYDETEYAQQVADRYATRHHRFTMEYDIIEELPEIIWHYGEPYSDSSALVTYALSREVRNHVTVSLSGDGGDELLLGYSRYFQLMPDLKTNQMKPRVVGPNQMDSLVRDIYMRRVAKFRDEHKMWGYGPALAGYLFSPSSDRFGSSLESINDQDVVEKIGLLESRTYLPDDLLVKTDIATMAHSLEGRSPFLDHIFAEWAVSLPQSVKIFPRNGEMESKALLKKAMEPYLPHECMYRKKMGFAVPVKHWMKNELRDFMTDSLTSKRFQQRGLLEPKFVKWMLDRHMNDIEDHGTRLWGLLCLELWYQTFIDGSGDRALSINVCNTGSVERLSA